MQTPCLTRPTNVPDSVVGTFHSEVDDSNICFKLVGEDSKNACLEQSFGEKKTVIYKGNSF